MKRFGMQVVVPALLAFGLLQSSPATAQAQVKVGGTAFLDYYYQFSMPSEIPAGQNGFTYRRLYLTTDVKWSDAFSGRARLEASESTNSPKGPMPFVKDLYLRWKAASGHRLTFGVQPTPAFQVAEDVWGYRSLEKTALDLFGIVSSRDFGLQADGPLAGGMLSYNLLLANNSGTRVETDRYKRVYGTLTARPVDAFVFSIGADYAAYPAPRDGAVRVSAFGGYEGPAFALGVEGFLFNPDFNDVSEARDGGVSVFGRARVADGWELVGRVDRFQQRDPAGSTDEGATFGLAGVAYTPAPGIRIIPNLHILKDDRRDKAEAQARLTLELSF